MPIMPSAHPRYFHPKQRGFTLVELLVVVAISAILMAIAVPDFIKTTRSIQLFHQAKEMQSTIKFAKSEAVRRGQTIVMCRTNAEQSDCNAGSPSADWSSGWMVFVDLNGNNQYDAATEANSRLLLKEALSTVAEQTANKGTSVVTATGAPMANAIIFNPAGELVSGFGGQFTFSHSSVGSESKAYLIINTTGRVRVLNNTECNASGSGCS